MAATFTYNPSKSFTKSSKARILTAKFGDGYSQRIGDGINTVTNEWSLSFNSRSVADANAIIEFFESRINTLSNIPEPFYWTPPGEYTTYTVICEEWTKSYDSHISATIQARFIQVFDKVL